jgi:hypothetical protein
VTKTDEGATEPRYRLELVIVGSEANQRSMTGEHCSHLVDAAALILALDIDPDVLSDGETTATPMPPAEVDHAASRPPPAPPAPPAPPPEEARLETGPRRPEPAPSTTSRLRLLGGTRLVLDDGSLPRTTLGVAAFVALLRGPLLLEAQATSYNERFTIAGPRAGRGGAYVSLATLEAHACYRRLLLDVDWRACVTAELGLESTTGVSVTKPESASGFWSAAGLMFGVRALPRSRVSPTAGLVLVHPISAPPVFIEGFGTVFEPRAVVVRCFLGLDVLFL